jgi:hypothetical protein
VLPLCLNTVMPTAEGVNLKFQRARDHAADLEQKVRRFLDSNPFEVYEEEEQSTGDLLTCVRVHRQPPPELSLIIGDLIHDCRTALDHLAWQLVLANGNQPDEKTMFPIARSKNAFPSYAQKCLKGASKQTISGIEKLRPYQGGDERFWRLHRLDIEDKHRLLIPVGAAYRNFEMLTSFLGTERIPAATFPPLPIRPADRQYPLQDGAIVLRIMKAARESQQQGMMRTEHRFTFEVAFSDDTAVAGEPITPTLANLVDEIHQQVQPLIILLT